MITAHGLDAMVLLTNCDKVTPAMLMAAGRLNIPAIVVTGGRWIRAVSREEDLLHRPDRSGRKGRKGEMIRGPGADGEGCQHRSRGLRPDGNGQLHEHPDGSHGHDFDRRALIPAAYGARVAWARQSGHLILEPASPQLAPRDILSEKAFENAIAVDMAIGGSTNSCLHLPAIAREVGVELTMERFSRIAEKTPSYPAETRGQHFPLICMKPAGGGPHERIEPPWVDSPGLPDGDRKSHWGEHPEPSDSERKGHSTPVDRPIHPKEESPFSMGPLLRKGPW